MNIGFFKRPKTHSALTTLFFIGMVASACALYLLPSQMDTLPQTYFIVGVTFLLATLSLYLTARSKKFSVVYLEKKKETHTIVQQNPLAQSQLNLKAFEKIFEASTDLSQKVINQLCEQLQAGQGAIYLATGSSLALACGYALSLEKEAPLYAFAEGLIGGVAALGQSLYLDKLPAGYITIFSGLGAAAPSHLFITPLKNENTIIGVMEIATFGQLNENTRKDVESLAGQLAGKIKAQSKKIID